MILHKMDQSLYGSTVNSRLSRKLFLKKEHPEILNEHSVTFYTTQGKCREK